MILFENSGSDDLQDVVDTEFRTGRFSIRTPMVDALFYENFGDEVERIPANRSRTASTRT